MVETVPVDAVAATMQHYFNKIEGVKSVMDRSVLANLYLLAKDHNAQMKSKVCEHVPLIFTCTYVPHGRSLKGIIGAFESLFSCQGF